MLALATRVGYGFVTSACEQNSGLTLLELLKITISIVRLR